MGVQALGPPLVHEGRYEVNSRLHSDDETGFQAARQAQGAQSELGAALHLTAVTHPVFAQALHVVNVQPQHMPQPVRKKERVGASGHRFMGVSLEQADLAKSFGQAKAGQLVHLAVLRAGCHRIDGGLLDLQQKGVELFLAHGKTSAHGQTAGDVAGVVQAGFGPAVVDSQIAPDHAMGMGGVVQNFSTHAVDRRKRPAGRPWRSSHRPWRPPPPAPIPPAGCAAWR